MINPINSPDIVRIHRRLVDPKSKTLTLRYFSTILISCPFPPNSYAASVKSVAVFRGQIFRSKGAPTTTSMPLPPDLESYMRTVAGRCLAMLGRPASDIGVAGLLAEACEANIAPEQRWGGWKTFAVMNGALCWSGVE